MSERRGVCHLYIYSCRQEDVFGFYYSLFFPLFPILTPPSSRLVCLPNLHPIKRETKDLKLNQSCRKHIKSSKSKLNRKVKKSRKWNVVFFFFHSKIRVGHEKRILAYLRCEGR